MAEVIQTSQTASIEPVNGTILNHREMARLSDPHDWTSKGTRTRGHAHGYTPRLPPKHRPRSNAPGTWEASIWASAWLATSRPRTRLHSRAFILLTLWSFCRSWGCPSGWRGCKTAATFIACICWRDTSWANGSSSYDHRCNRKHLQDPGWQRYTLLAFCHFDNEICFKRSIRGCGHLTCKVSEKLQYIQYCKGTIIYFPVYHEIQNEMSCPRYISLTSALFP